MVPWVDLLEVHGNIASRLSKMKNLDGKRVNLSFS